uniref:EGF-like domain-containing protein n=1 Tax=Chenopodium quinoa TaxID=63459 RepID=A0A803NAK4_CHEQI
MFTAPNITKPNCPRKCGDLTIPYPFGVGFGAGCSRSLWYDIFCMTSFNPPKAFLLAANDQYGNAVEILDISESHVRLRNQVLNKCFNSTAVISPEFPDTLSFNLVTTLVPYSVSGTANKLFVVGCHDASHFESAFDATPTVIPSDQGTSCSTYCSFDARNVAAGKCNGNGCCQAVIPGGMMRSYSLSFDILMNHTSTVTYNPCGYSFVADQESFKFRGIPDLNDPNFVNRTAYEAPLALDWFIENDTCADAQRDLNSYACVQNTTCVDVIDSDIGGYRCSCLPSYQGHPYLSPGCSDINECADPSSSPCSMICTNIPGNYTCSCPSGYAGDGRKQGTGCKRQFPVMKVALGTNC